MRTELGVANRKATAEFQKLRDRQDFVKAVSDSAIDLPQKRAQLQVLTDMVARLRDYFKNNVVRRTIKSVDCDGNPISGLEAYNEIVLKLKPFPVEEEVLEENAQATVNEYKGALSKVAKDLGHVSDFVFTSLRRWVHVQDVYQRGQSLARLGGQRLPRPLHVLDVHWGSDLRWGRGPASRPGAQGRPPLWCASRTCSCAAPPPREKAPTAASTAVHVQDVCGPHYSCMTDPTL